MATFFRALYTLSLALWFGSVAFFTIAGLLIFNAFADESRRDASDRPLWFPLPAAFDQPTPEGKFPDPLRLEQGSRAAGLAVSRIFPVYYGMQVGCGLLVLLLAPAGGAGKTWRNGRTLLACLALASVLAGWWLELRVSQLRQPRNQLTDAVLLSEAPSAELLQRASIARETFGRWHGYSLLQNFATLGLTAWLTLLLARRDP